MFTRVVCMPAYSLLEVAVVSRIEIRRQALRARNVPWPRRELKSQLLIHQSTIDLRESTIDPTLLYTVNFASLFLC